MFYSKIKSIGLWARKERKKINSKWAIRWSVNRQISCLAFAVDMHAERILSFVIAARDSLPDKRKMEALGKVLDLKVVHALA